MKKLFSFLYLMLVSAIGFSQWFALNSNITSDLLSTHFTDINTGYAVGASGKIIKTIDAGVTWSAQSSGTTLYLVSIFFTDINTGYAVGQTGTIVKTIDAGATWTALTSGTIENLWSVYFTNTMTGYIVGNTGTVLKTIDAGVTWLALTSGTSNILYSVYFVDDNIGYAVGLNSTILKTTDAGANWTPQNSGTFYDLQSVYFKDANTGYAVGNGGTIVKTIDGGTTWAAQTSGTVNILYSACFTNTNTGYIVGDAGTILQTIDAGNTWSVRASGTASNLRKVFFADANVGYAIGDAGTIIKTSCGSPIFTNNPQIITSGSSYSFNGHAYITAGNYHDTLTTSLGCDSIIITQLTVNPVNTKWFALNSGTIYTLNSTYFTDANTGYAVGGAGTILKTTDAGTIWTPQSSGTTVYLFSVFFANASIGYAAGQAGTIRQTSNGGSTWTPITSGTSYDIWSMYFTNTNTGYAVGGAGTILKTTDAGSSWNPLTSGTPYLLYSVFFADASTGYAVGQAGTIIKTTDGGTVWSTLSSGITYDINSVFFTDINTGYAVANGGIILKTIDGGANWVQQISGSGNILYSVRFTNANSGYIVGDVGTILHTNNAGVNWFTEASGITNSLFSVMPATANTAYTVGYDPSNTGKGIILKTNCGTPSSGTNLKTICNGEIYTFNGHTYTIQGIYYDTLATMGGCDSIITTTLTVKPLPTSTVSSNSPVCEGGNLDLFANAFPSYQWAGPNGFTSISPNPIIINATLAASGIYTVTVTDINNCSNTDQLNVNINPLPTVNAGLNLDVCAGSSVTLLGSGAISYSWDNSVINGSSFTPLTTTTYNVTGTDANGCANTDNVIVAVNQVFSVNNPQTICSGNSYFFNGHTYAISGNYTDTLYTVYGCDSIITTQLIVGFSITAAITPPTLYNFDGIINLTINGGTPPYYFNWANGATTEDNINVGFVNNHVTIGDSNGCSLDTIIRVNSNLIAFNGDTIFVHPSDNNSTGIWWGGYDTIANAISFTDGIGNTNAIVSHYGAGDYAAYLCDSSTAFGFNNWYLPAKDELNELFINKDFVGGFGSGLAYWSSSQFDATHDWSQYFTNGFQGYGDYYSYGAVRCVRSSHPATALSITATIIPPTLYQFDGSINLVVNGGTPPYTFIWANGGITENAANIGFANNFVTISDNAGATIDTNIQVNSKLLKINNDTIYVHPIDNATGIVWGSNGIITNATSDINGQSNTNVIVSSLGAGAYAAYVCDTLTAYGHSDWYLPAKDELNVLYTNKDFVGGFANYFYWSSSEFSADYVTLQNFNDGVQSLSQKNYLSNYDVRCIRSSHLLSNLTIQQRLDTDETPKHIFDSGITLDSLYGKTYQAGLIFYLDTINGNGMVAAPKDQNIGVGAAWGCYGVLNTGADGTAIGTGQQNSLDIIAGCTTAGIAAYIADTLTLNGYSDWYLPSKDELNAMFSNLYLNGFGVFISDYYTSSSQYDASNAWAQEFFYGNQSIKGKYINYLVRCVRPFQKVNNLTILKANNILTCHNDNTGRINIFVTGGKEPYTYHWSNGNSTANLNGLSAGTYIVTVTDADAVSAIDTVIISQPAQITSNNPQTICQGSSYVFNSHTYTLAGAYHDSLISALGCDSIITTQLTVNPLPDSSFAYTASGSTLTFTTPAKPSASYYWEFGDGGTSNDASPQYTFASGGYYNVCLTVMDNYTLCQNQSCQQVLVGSPVSSCFAMFAYTANANIVSFGDSSLGTPTSWYWQFGDGTIATDQHPLHNFTAAGIYTVQLTINTGNCMSDFCSTIEIGNFANDCEASYTNYSDLAAKTVYFTNTSVGTNLTHFLWNFADGDTSSLENPVHTFATTNYYNVCLSVWNSAGCFNISCSQIKVGQDIEPCVAQFVYAVDTISRTVVFHDFSNGNPNEWSWDFGDGVQSAAQHPIYQYAGDGFYLVHLNIKNLATGCNEDINNLINVKGGNKHLKCDFGYLLDTTYHKANQYPVDFMAAIYGDAAKLVWDFGDGSPFDSTTSTPTHIYAAKGIYTAELSVEDPIIGESDNYSRIITIDSTVSIAENTYIPTFSLYPNPAKDRFAMQFYLPTDGNVIVTIFDMYGKEIEKIAQTMESGSKRIYCDTKKLPAGIYTVSLKSKSNQLTKKLVLTH